VEHLQLLVFIFHNFSMAQRKALLTYCARVLTAVSDSSSVTHTAPLPLCHLLLLLDFFLHHLSKPPQDLFKQVCNYAIIMFAISAKPHVKDTHLIQRPLSTFNPFNTGTPFTWTLSITPQCLYFWGLTVLDSWQYLGTWPICQACSSEVYAQVLSVH